MKLTQRTSWKIALSLGTALALTACSQAQLVDTPIEDVVSERAYFQTLLNTPFTGDISASAQPVDFAAAFVDLPEGVRLETGAVSIDSATGATRVEDFAIVYDLDGTGVGLEADEVLFYNFDPNAIADRIRGTNLDATLKVADRIEMRGVKSVGMEAVSTMMMEEYIGTIEDFTDEDNELVEELNAVDIFSYNFGIQKLLIDGLVLEPFEYAAPEAAVTLDEDGEPIDEFEVMDEDRVGLQMFAAFMRSYSVDALAYQNMSASYAMNMDGIELSQVMSIGSAGMRGYSRGDLDFSGGWDTQLSGQFPFPNETGEGPEMIMMPMLGGVGSSEVSGMRFSKALEALANWEMPSKDVTDLMDLGRWELTDYLLDLDDKTLLKSEKIVFDSDFRWFLPTRIELDIANTGYEVSNLLSIMTDSFGEELGSEFTPEQLSTGLSILDQYGFGCFCGDYKLTATWDEDTGAMAYREASRFAQAFAGTTSFDIGFSTPDAIAGLFESDDPEAAFEDLMVSDLEFRNFEMTLTDIEGLGNLFAMLHEIGKAFPEQQGMAMLTYNDADQLRAFAVNAVIGVTPMVRSELPGAEPWMNALAGFIEEGGTLKVSANPSSPINAETIEAIDSMDEEPSPEALVELFGLTVTHTK